MMCAPQICHPDDQMTAASLMVACLGIGLCTGAALSSPFTALALSLWIYNDNKRRSKYIIYAK